MSVPAKYTIVKTIKLLPEEEGRFYDKIQASLSAIKPFICLDSHRHKNKELGYHQWDWLMAAGSSAVLSSDEKFPAGWREFTEAHRGEWLFGLFGYDLRNMLFKTVTEADDRLQLPDIYWFAPVIIAGFKGGELHLYSHDSTLADQLLNAVAPPVHKEAETAPVVFTPRTSREDYLKTVIQLKEHIQRGDIYEVNYCTEFFAENVIPDLSRTWKNLSEKSPMPFSACFETEQFALLSASPERFLCTDKNKVTVQPMKGTIRRGKDAEEDEMLKQQLRADPKEQSENVMIVDLTRNDLSRTAARGTVKVEELFGVQQFEKVFQMVSTISSEMDEKHSLADLVASCFPMGSMTGAPKKRAMELIDRYEETKRGVFSGSVGYVDPRGNMDLNVLIRTLVYNKQTRYLSLSVGSAITIHSDPEKEYDECMLKADPVLKSISYE